MEENQNRQIVPFDNPELVVLRNPVARAKFGLSLVQSKILFEIIAYLKTRPNDNFMTINVGDLLHKIGVETKRVKYYVDEIEEMTKKHLRIPEGDNEEGINYLAVNLLAGARFRIDKDGRGTIDIEISSMLKPYYLEIAKGDFFSYHILNTRLLKSTYSVKLYLLLKSYKRFGKLDILLEELKNILELGPTDYKQFPDFKKRVLERARIEIQEKNDICFTYDEVRQSARNAKSPVVRIVFHIKDNPDQKLRVDRLDKEKRSKRAGEQLIAYEAVIQTDLGVGEEQAPGTAIKTNVGGKKKSNSASKKEAQISTTSGLEDQKDSITGATARDQPNIKTNIGGAPKTAKTKLSATIRTDLGVGEEQHTKTTKTNLGPTSQGKATTEKNSQGNVAEMLRLFRHFDKKSSDEFILDYVSGLGYDWESVLDALYYTQQQGTVRNVFAYLPTILRSQAGQGLAEKARRRILQSKAAEESKQQLKSLKTEINGLYEKIEKMKRDIVRSIVAEDKEASSKVIAQVKAQYAGSFGIDANTSAEQFRETPLLRSLVVHEFRVMFPKAFEQENSLTEMEAYFLDLKNRAKAIDPHFSI